MKLSRGTYYSVGALAGAALMLESTLTRLLAVAQYYHFAFLVVSLALLGFGASGSFLSLFPGWKSAGEDRSSSTGRERIVVLAGTGFAASLAVAYLIVNWLPFDSYSIAWDRIQVLYFGLYYLVLTLPFLFAGLGIGAVLSSSKGESNRVYAVNLMGSAAGILMGLLLMQQAGVPGALIASGVIGLSAILGQQGLISRMLRFGTWLVMVAGTVGVILIAYSNHAYSSPIGISISPYKGLPYALQVPGADQTFAAWNAISRIDVISGASTHVLPGLSYTYKGKLPDQLGMAFDGDALRPVTLVEPENFQAAGYLPEASAFLLRPGGKVLVLDSGSGLGVMQAVAGRAGDIIAVMDNALVLQAIRQTAPGYDIYSHPAVRIESAPSRVYLAGDSPEFDLILQPLNDPYRPVASGAYSLAEDYDLTVEAITAMLSRLNNDGTLVVTRWLQTPPSEELRMLATIVEALNRLEIENPGSKLVAYRGIQTMTYLVNPAGWQDVQLDLMRNFTADRRYDLVWAPGIRSEEVNRFNRMQEPIYFQQFGELMASDGLKSSYADHEFAVQPATDDRPFFFHFFKWEQTPQVLATFGRVWQPFGGSGYFVLVALLILVSIFSMGLILVPLLVMASRSRQQFNSDEVPRRRIPAWKVMVYFGSIGIAFLFLEIPLIQSSILSLGHPAYAFGFVVLILLLSSSLGSFYAPRFWERKTIVLLLLLGAAVLVPFIFRQLQITSLEWPEWLRVISLGACLVPLGILMGFPFPFGLQWLEQAESKLIPWAWGVNGCASVVAAVLAAIISLSAGFTVVLLVGAFFYAAAVLVIR